MELITYDDFLKNQNEEQKIIQPFKIYRVQPVGVDLTLGDECFNLTTGERMFLSKGGVFPVRHGDFVVVGTQETLNMPDNVFGLVCSRVSLTSQGLTQFGNKIDPGFQDKLQLSFLNAGNRVIELTKDMPICNVIFFRLPRGTGKTYEGGPHQPSTLEPPLSFRYELTEKDIPQLEKHYAREFVDLYITLWDRIGRMQRNLDAGVKRLDYVLYAILAGVAGGGVVVIFAATIKALIQQLIGNS